jgi:hypothetical protein
MALNRPAHEFVVSKNLARPAINRTRTPNNFDIGNNVAIQKFQEEHSCGVAVGPLP